MKKRINIVTTVNARSVYREGGMIHIRDVVPVVSGIVMNGLLYGDDALAKGVLSLNQAPAPAGHPKDAAGNFISAKSGEALSKAYIGAYVHNARHADGKTLCDITVNEGQANAMPEGRELVARLEAAINGADIEPIHVSTGLMLNIEQTEGVSMGKKYRGNVKDIAYDHLAILLNQEGAGTPSQGVGMFLNAEGAQEEVETVTLEWAANKSPILERAIKWIGKLFGNDDLSFYETMDKLRSMIGEQYWIVDCYGKEVIYSDGTYSFKQEYFVDDEGKVTLIGSAVEVTRKVEYDEVKHNSEESSHMKEQILAALNAAGVGVEGLTDAQILAAYNSVVTKPTQDKLAAANAKIAEVEQAERAKVELEVNALADKLAVNSQLTAEDFKSMPVARLRELASNAQAAPISIGTHAQTRAANEFDGVDLNALMGDK